MSGLRKSLVSGMSGGKKKVQYVELISDLIFVYLVRRNDELLHMGADGFFSASAFYAYVMSTAVIMEVWASSTLYINRYGRNKLQYHVFSS